jgi:hypothetical protein
MSRRVTYFNSSFTSIDPDASQFIGNWEVEATLSLGVPTEMGIVQKLAVNDFYRGWKGEGTPNGTNNHAIAVANNARVYLLIPFADGTANGDIYCLDAVSNGVLKGSYLNMVAGDFTAQGVIGGTGKAFSTLTGQNFYNINNVGIGAYCRTNQAANNALIFGAGTNFTDNSMFMNPRNLSDENTFRLNDSTAGFSNLSLDSRGWRMIQRSGTTRELWKDDNLIYSDSVAAIGQSTRDVLFHAFNAGIISSTTTRQLCCYVYGMPYLTLAQSQDFYTVIQRLQSNVIVGGRQIGAAIPPI